MSDSDYVLGTDDEELARLGLQHRVWLPYVLDAWKRAGITSGMTVIDVGAGPGYASIDLASLVGRHGCVIALERSSRFVSAIQARTAQLGIANVEARVQDVCTQPFGKAIADASWCRWLLSFVPNPARTVGLIAEALKPGGIAVFHEYANYGSWRLMPPSAELERFTTLVMQSWRDSSGEPDAALGVPAWLRSSGLEVISVKPLVEIVRPNDPMWQWPASFLRSGASRLRDLGYVDDQEAERLATALDKVGDARMMTPLVAEIIARKPAADYEI